MKRFYKSVSVEQDTAGWQIFLDSRPLKTAMGNPQSLPSNALAQAMALEWDKQGETIDPALFRHRDLADYAIDIVHPDRDAAIARLLGFIETDTLCYRADPDAPLFRKQQQLWDPLLAKLEARAGVTLERISGIMHRPQAPETHKKLAARLNAFDDFTLASVLTMASLAASLSIALLAAETDTDIHALWAAANLEEDWQIEQWGQDHEAEDVRDRRTADFLNAYEFSRLVAVQV